MIKIIGDIVNGTLDGLASIVEFLTSAFEFLYTIITFIPNPFRIHLYSFIGLLVIIIIVKNVRGYS